MGRYAALSAFAMRMVTTTLGINLCFPSGVVEKHSLDMCLQDSSKFPITIDTIF